MAENLYCRGQKVLSKKGREEWDRIFSNHKYPEEVKMDAVERLRKKVRRQMEKGEVHDHFC